MRSWESEPDAIFLGGRADSEGRMDQRSPWREMVKEG